MLVEKNNFLVGVNDLLIGGNPTYHFLQLISWRISKKIYTYNHAHQHTHKSPYRLSSSSHYIYDTYKSMIYFLNKQLNNTKSKFVNIQILIKLN